LSSTVIGFTAVVFFGRPGELVRPYLIARKEKVTVASQVAAWVVERIYDLLVVLLLFGFALTQVEGRETIGPKLDVVLRTGGYLAAILAIACVGLLFLSVSFEAVVRRWFSRLASLLPARIGSPVAAMFESFFAGMCWAGSPRVVLELILFSLLEWGIIVASIYCLFQAYPATTHLNLVDNLVFTGFVAFGAAVQLPGIGGGLQVAAVLALTEIFGLGIETATGLAVFLWAVSWLLVVPFGVVLAFRDGLRWTSLRHVDEEMAKAPASS
jgi:uncharacterized membrane protein YbhN (UPF0104 family)